MVNPLDLVKFFGAVGPIYRGELLLNFIIFITCMQYYIQRSIAWYYMYLLVLGASTNLEIHVLLYYISTRNTAVHVQLYMYNL